MRFQSHATSARPAERVSNLTGRLPGLARETLIIFSLFLRAVAPPPPRGFEAATCSFARAQGLLWEVARCLQSAYEAESAMPLYRPSDTVGTVQRRLRGALIRDLHIEPRQNAKNHDFIFFRGKL